MAVEGEYEPSPWEPVAQQVAQYEATGGREGGTLNGMPVVILTTTGRKSGNVRKSPVMRVERDGKYAVVASLGGAPQHPVWYLNLVANPDVTLQDGADVQQLRARVATGEERVDWWRVANEAYPEYDTYQTRTDREIPVVVLDPR